jgi:peptidoglycan/LPS O-acetylase OafA/YrhL
VSDQTGDEISAANSHPQADGNSRAVKPHFRGDIEGLRGISIILVLLFHAKIAGFGGGFVGVDVFFVLSGFLITGLLLREVESTGRISLSQFYARRARRLLPAAALVLVVTLVVSYLMLPDLLLPGIAIDTAAAALYVSNINFAHHATDYFASNTAPSPILHFWSLSVEEQFYMFWPAIVLLVTRKARVPRINVRATLLIVGISSFAFAIWLLKFNAPWAFFSLPTRAWELALGGLLAVSKNHLEKVPKFAARIFSWVGVSGVILSGLFIKESAPFPGIPALLPTISAALVIAAGVHQNKTIPTRVLESAPLRFLGRISYSLYLWHWPVLVIPAVLSITPLPLKQRILLALGSIVLAAITQRFIEDPLRKGHAIGIRPRWNLITATAVALTVTTAAFAINTNINSHIHKTTSTASADQNAQRLDALIDTSLPRATDAGARTTTVDFPVPADIDPSLATAATDRALSYKDGCHTQMNMTPSTKPCLYGNLDGSKTIVLFGDSHALSWDPALDQVATTHGWKFLSLTMSACTPADIPAWNPALNSVMKNCTIWRKATIAKIVAAKPYIVIIAGTRGFATVDAGGKVLSGAERTAAYDAGMKRTIDEIKTSAQKVILIQDTPVSKFDPPVCLATHRSSTLGCATPLEKAISSIWQSEEQLLASEESIRIIDPSFWICPTAPCPVVIGNLVVYSDPGHLTATFSAALAGRVGDAIVAAIR